MNTSKKISIRFNSKVIPLEGNVSSFEDLKNFIRQKFDSLPEKIRIYYIDQDNDEISISCDGDLESFEYEEKDIEINIKPYSDSDVTDNEDDDEEVEEEEEEDEDEVSSCCDSDSGEERARVSHQKEEVQSNADEIREKGQDLNEVPKQIEIQKSVESQIQEDEIMNNSSLNSFSDVEDIEEESKDNQNNKEEKQVNAHIQSSPQKISIQDQSIQCGTENLNLETKDQSNQVGVCVKDQEQQVLINQCDQSQQAKIAQCDAQGQTFSIEKNDISIQIQIDSKDNQSQAQVEQIDNSLQTLQIESSDHQTQTKVELCDNQIQADVIQQQDFQQQAYTSQCTGLSSQPYLPIVSAIATNTEDIFKQSQKEDNTSTFLISQKQEEKIRQLEENQERLMRILDQQSKKFETQLVALQDGLINDKIQERITQMVDARVNELLPEYSRANWDNFRRQEKLSRFDRIFQELSPQYNKLAFINDTAQLNTTYDELTSMLMQKLEIARDMYLKEMLQNQPNQKNSSIVSDQVYASSQIKKQLHQKDEEIQEEIQEERKEISDENKSKQSELKPIAELPLVMKKKESRYEDDSIVEERLKDYQQRLRQESLSEEERLKNILSEKEKQANLLNQEVILNRHKDYPDDVVSKAKQIAQLTQENPNIYLQYVLDYKQLTVNDLIDQIYTTNVMERYSTK